MFGPIPPRMILCIPLIGGIAFVFVVTVARFGLVLGEEFAPDTFERRAYRYYALPLVRLKITPIRRSVRRHPFETFLVTDKFVVPQEQPRRWDIITASRGGAPWRRGDAQILCHYLDAWDHDKPGARYWESWTRENPALAHVLWPEVAQLARRDLYALIPAVFDEALAHDDPQPLRRALRRILASGYESLAATRMELGNHEAAAYFFGEALRYEPGRTASLEGRELCRDRLRQPHWAAGAREPTVPAEAEDR